MSNPKTPEGKQLELDAKPSLTLRVAGRMLCITHESSSIRRFEIESGTELKKLPIEGAWLGTGRDRMVRPSKKGFEVIDLDGHVLASLEPPSKQTFMWRVDNLDLAGKIACGTQGPNAYVWDARSGKVIHAFEDIGYVDIVPSPDGTQVAITRGKKPMFVASTKDWKLVEIPDGKIRTRTEVAWSPDGSQLVLYSYTEAIILDVHAKKLVTRLKLLHPYTCLYVPNHHVFLAGSGKRISIWDTRTWKPRGEVAVSAPRLAVTESGDRIITGNDDAPPIEIWDTAQLLGSVKIIEKKPRSPTPRPAKRRVSAIFFGVPRAVKQHKIIEAVGSLHHILDRQPPELAVRVLPADHKRDRHWFHIVGTRGRNYLLEPWIECLQTDFKAPLDVVMHLDLAKKIEARRYSTPFSSTPIEVEPDYLGVLDVSDPVLVIEDGRRANKKVKPDDISSLVHCVELRWPL
jgi:hypothetical protein